ncbi:MAG: hypothetical protein U1F08_00700 [Steroidobacteraceae bacterium]
MDWEPPVRYGLRPWLALWVGVIALLTGLGWAVATGSWEDWQWALTVLGVALVVYGAVVVQMRREYRRDSKWNRSGGSG